ncbi:MAG: hypothetical protein O0X93_08370 [Methanocorpusculum sp.]|nr:hypothetical protein [Methanocorpusculum sp.]MDE2523152.1 hypothetical protein [Methanocorpusculum sp.]MDE2525016.1 hypothetical protein [Methanocorpusculum sp.]
MTAYRKCNICGNVWRTRETSRIPQCNQCRSKSSTEATEADYIEYRKNEVDASDAPTEDSTPQTTEETLPEEPVSATDTELLDPDVDISALISGKQKNSADNIKHHIHVPKELIIAAAVGVGVAFVAGIIYFRAPRSNRRTQRSTPQPEEQIVTSTKRIHVSGFT